MSYYQSPLRPIPPPPPPPPPPPYFPVPTAPQTATLPENPRRAIVLASALLATMMIACFVTMASQSNQQFYTFSMRLMMLACASYLIQKDGVFYKVTAVAATVLATLSHTIGYVAANFSEGTDANLDWYLMGFIGVLIISAAVVGTSFLTAKLIKGGTRAQTSVAALLCGGIYLIANTIASLIFDIIYQIGGFLHTITIDGIGSIPDAVGLGLAIKLVSMLCLLKSPKLQVEIGTQVWFGVCVTFTSLSLLSTLLSLYTNGRIVSLWQDFLIVPLTTAAIVGYILLFGSRRIGYVIILVVSGIMFFDYLSYTAGLILSKFSAQSSPSTSEITTCLVITLIIALTPAITSIALHRAWTTEPIQAAPFVNPYIPYPPPPW